MKRLKKEVKSYNRKGINQKTNSLIKRNNPKTFNYSNNMLTKEHRDRGQERREVSICIC